MISMIVLRRSSILISQRTYGQATCLCDEKIKLLRLGYLKLEKTYKMFHLNATSMLATSKLEAWGP